ncbi:MAG: ferrochelatase hem15 [Chaenotheca gracillima]|nr:MAG: ferrochelatase hem15 [Chaenotheca gracillima]
MRPEVEENTVEVPPSSAVGTTTKDAEPLPLPRKVGGYFTFLRSWKFYQVMLLGQVLALCITGTNTFTSLLSAGDWSVPAFQTFINYVCLNVVYSSYTIYRYGFKKYAKLLFRDGWRYFILSFLDVEGNYFTVLAYRYTTILSAQLINFWAIVVVVVISFFFLHVRYRKLQLLGILLACAGMGVLLASDHITGSNGGPAADALKGDLFALVGATFYGMSNVAEEYLVSQRPLYEVVGQIGFWGMLINGTQAGIFDRGSFQSANWRPAVGGYLTGYTCCLFIFYTGAPLMFRLASAAFFNISLLTGNFWGVIIGVKVFDYNIHFMYPIAFVLIMLGLLVYFVGKKILDEARKPWLGEHQEAGVNGIGTYKWTVEKEQRRRGQGEGSDEGEPRPGTIAEGV